MIVMAELGARLSSIPFWSSAILAGGLLRRCPSEQRWRTQVAAGTVVSAALESPDLTATFEDGECRISGCVQTVLDAPRAEAVLILARTDKGGVVLALVDAPDFTRTDFATIDGRSAANLTFADCPARLLASDGGAEMIVAAAIDEACLALSAESVGAMDALLSLTLEHVRNRKQFGHPLGEFQAVRHGLVDLYSDIEGCRSLLFLATSTQANGGAASRQIAALKSRTGRVGWAVGEAAVQLFGGMGMSDDLPVGRYLKRLMATDMMLGNASYHLQRFARAA
jgi:alkylation response protein AidB-like acyl-CoA dehydrogenase